MTPNELVTTVTAPMSGGQRFPSALGAGLLLLLAIPACGDEVDYGYFSVRVSAADSATPDYLSRIAACGVNVDGAAVDFSALACSEGSVTQHELGVFEWSTATKSGTVRFTVTLKDGIGRLLGTGTSAEVAISPGRTVETTVLVTPAPGALMPPM
jgi:hypothetical protein